MNISQFRVKISKLFQEHDAFVLSFELNDSTNQSSIEQFINTIDETNRKFPLPNKPLIENKAFVVFMKDEQSHITGVAHSLNAIENLPIFEVSFDIEQVFIFHGMVMKPGFHSSTEIENKKIELKKKFDNVNISELTSLKADYLLYNDGKVTDLDGDQIDLNDVEQFTPILIAATNVTSISGFVETGLEYNNAPFISFA